MIVTARRWVRWKRASVKYWFRDQLHSAHVRHGVSGATAGCHCDIVARPGGVL